MTAPFRILMVCLGNICRSPMAEGALRERLRAYGLGDRVVVDSAGIGDWHVGQAPDPRAIACAQRHGVDIGDQRARQVRPEDFRRFDLLLAADVDVLQALRGRRPADGAARLDLLLPWSQSTDRREIPDPYTGDEADFETVWSLVDAAAEAIIRRRRWDAGPQ